MSLVCKNHKQQTKRKKKNTNKLLQDLYLSYLLLLPDSNMFMEWLSCGDLLDRGRIRMSADTCLGVLDRLSMGELSLLDSVLESGRKISVQNCI